MTGCGGPDVRSYVVPKPHDVPGFAPETATEFRILGAMVPAENPVWFFKAAGSASQIAAFEADFDAFLKSLTFPGGPGQPPKWSVAEGVKTGPPREFRYATLLFPVNGQTVELAVSEAKGGLQANLDRWAGQVGAKSTDGATSPVTLGPVAGLKVSLVGPKNPSDSRAMMAPR